MQRYFIFAGSLKGVNNKWLPGSLLFLAAPVDSSRLQASITSTVITIASLL
jgi:hypothetical protein